jgi:hypothetical protein
MPIRPPHLTLLALVGAGCAGLPPCPAQGGPDWWLATSAHFRLQTDLEEAQARALAIRLEESRAAMLALWWGGAAGPPGQTRVFALSSRHAIANYAGPGVAGIWNQRSPLPGTIVVTDADSSYATHCLKHELAHSLSHWFTPVQPLWFSEGMARYLESVEYERGRARVGADVQLQYHDLLRWQMMGSARVLAREDAPEGGGDLIRFEASSWLLFQYLRERRPEPLRQLEARLRDYQPPQSAWAALFPDLSSSHLDDELYHYAAKGRFKSEEQPLSIGAPAVQTRKMPDADVHAARALLFSSLSAPAEDVAVELAEALRQDPSHLEALTLLYLQDSEPDRRRGIALRAQAAHPDDWLAQLLVCEAAGPKSPAGVAALARALALAPEEPEVLKAAARASAQRGLWPETAVLASRAIQLGATEWDLRVLQVMALAYTGKCAAAARLAEVLPRLASPYVATFLTRDWSPLHAACRDKELGAR